MRIRFLGTAAADGYPNPFCSCDNCRQARAAGGPSLRRRSAVLINDDLLIDLGPDVIAATQAHGIALTALRYCLQTHEHEDHLHPALFLAHSPATGVPAAPRLHFYAAEAVLAQIRQAPSKAGTRIAAGLSETLNLTFHAIAPLQPFIVGSYRVTALRAAHDSALDPLLYLIEQDGRALLYATDTGPLPDVTWEALRRWGGRLDLVIMDHTFGLARPTPRHLNSEQFLVQVARLREEKLLAPDVRIYAHHLAHHSNPPHEALVRHAAARGYLVAYDGLQITLCGRPGSRVAG